VAGGFNKKATQFCWMAFRYFFAGVSAATASAGLAFLTSCGRVFPYEPIAIFPLRVFLSPFPIKPLIYFDYVDFADYSANAM
jgi:hypothetical protein